MRAPGRIALFLRALDNDYQELIQDDCRQAARLRGFTLRDASAQNDADTQLHQIYESLRSPESIRPHAILVSPVRESVLRLVAREAARLGVGWVSLNRSSDYLQELRREFPKLPIFSVDPDQRQIGRLQGQQFRILLPRGGELLYIQGSASTSSAQQRLAGVEGELTGTAIDMVTFAEDWSVEGGVRAAKSWLQVRGHAEWAQAVVGAQNDSMAMGARNILKETGLQEVRNVRVTGCDGSARYGQRLVMERELTATVVIPSPGRKAIEEVAAVLEGGRPPTSDFSLPVSSYPELDMLMRSSFFRVK